MAMKQVGNKKISTMPGTMVASQDIGVWYVENNVSS